MKKIGLVLAVVLLIALCTSCHMNQKCPAYADNSATVEQNA